MPILHFARNHILFVIILLAGIISLIFGIMVFGDAGWGDWYYARIFVPVNKTWQAVMEYSSVPFYMVMIFVLFILIIAGLISSSGNSWKSNLLSSALFLVSSGIFLAIIFYWMWGYNYGRTTIGQSYFQNEYLDMDSTTFKRRWALQTNRVNTLRAKVVMPGEEDIGELTREYEDLYRNTVRKLPFFFDLNRDLRPHCKEFVPEGFLLRLNTAGFYFPFGSESYVDQALHVSQKPAVIAHELAHGFGVTDEGEANFIGYILCQSSGDPLAQYSSALMLWLYMASDGRHLDADFTKSMWEDLSPAVWIDLDERRKLDDKFPEFMPRMRDAIYDSYLSMNQVEGGMKSYNRFVKMVLTYEKK